MKYILFLFLTLLAISCKEKYIPPFSSPPTGYLVVEGNINSGGATTVSLSRTATLEGNKRLLEKGATVQVQGEDNSTYTLPETTQGQYTIGMLQLNNSVKYRLHIKTAEGKEYLSDFEALKITPVIDSISWQRENGDVRLYVNAHDDQNKTQYYQWDYVETWQFYSPYLSVLKYYEVKTPDGIRLVIGYKDSTTFAYDPNILTCWNSQISTQLLIGSTAKLTKDVVYLPIATVPKGAKKISFLYSINVRQTALTKEAYEYLDKMKKNTEGNGSIFDPQPSELKGNVHCVSAPDELVIGFVTASTVQEKRRFIYRQEVPGWNYSPDCQLIVVANHPDSIAKYRAWIPSDVKETFLSNILSFTAVSAPICIDCTVEGSNVKPSFWP
jgi:hypothetical protein